MFILRSFLPFLGAFLTFDGYYSNNDIEFYLGSFVCILNLFFGLSANSISFILFALVGAQLHPWWVGGILGFAFYTGLNAIRIAFRFGIGFLVSRG